METENVNVKNWKSLIKPSKLDVKISDDLSHATIVAEPLEKGYGLTLDNSIKRILLNVDAFLPIHSIESMQNLTSLISKNLVKEHNDIITWHNKIEPQSEGLI